MSFLPRLAARARPLGRIAVLVSGAIGAAGLGFLIQFGLSRTLDISTYGRLVALLAVSNILATFAGWGIGWMWLQVFGSEGWEARRWVPVSVAGLSITSCGAVALMFGYVLAVAAPPSFNSLFIALAMISVMLSQSLIEVVASRLQLEERFGALAAWQLFNPLGRILVVGGVVLILGHEDLPSVVAGFALVGVASLATAIFSIWRMMRGGLRLVGHGPKPTARIATQRPTLRRLFSEALPYVLQTTFYLVNTQGIVAIVERLIGPSDAAIYNVAFLVMSAVYLVPGIIYTRFLVGKLFRWWEQDRQLFDAAFHLGVVVQLVLGVVAMAVVMLAAPVVIPWLFGDRYQGAVSILVILALAIPVRFVLHSYAAAFYSREHMLRKVGFMGGGAAIAVALNLVLAPAYGVNGAAIAAVCGNSALLALFFLGARRQIQVWSTFRLATLRRALADIGVVRGSR